MSENQSTKYEKTKLREKERVRELGLGEINDV